MGSSKICKGRVLSSGMKAAILLLGVAIICGRIAFSVAPGAAHPPKVVDGEGDYKGSVKRDNGCST